MSFELRPRAASFAVSLSLGLCSSISLAGAARPQISAPVDESKLTTLERNTHPAALLPQNDRGPVNDAFPMQHMLLELKRPPAAEARLQARIDAMHDPASPLYHRWLTAGQFGSEYGPAPEDAAQVRQWLESHGLSVNYAYKNGLVVDFSGTAAQVREAFHTGIHTLLLANGEQHIGNVNDPQIPSALAPAISGVVSLNDFFPRPRLKKLGAISYDHSTNKWQPHFTLLNGTTDIYTVGPFDFATIYDLLPLWKTGYTGKGVTIAVVEDTDLAHPSDWTTFRKTFGLDMFVSGSFQQLYPRNCARPDRNGDEGEAALDSEWAASAAPDAKIELAACANTQTTSGIDTAILNLLDSAPPDIISDSYGGCETQSGAAYIALENEEAKQAAAQGVTLFIAQGDSGSDECVPYEKSAYSMHGINSGDNTASAYAVDVGGTDFAAKYQSDTQGIPTSRYWNSKNDAETLNSALSYIPEIPWNDSCASQLIFSDPKNGGYVRAYSSSGFCDSAYGQEFFMNTSAGSGGPSRCFTGRPSVPGVVSGTCKGNPKPAWQHGVAGIPNDGVRDQPDLALFAADGVWGNSYVFCLSDTKQGGTDCTPANDATYLGGGGTSFAAPAMAGIQALIDQKHGRQGNANYVYYALAAAQLKQFGPLQCGTDQPGGALPASGCIFHDITRGDIDIPCGRNYDDNFYNCFGVSNVSFGELSQSMTTAQRAYQAGVGYDFATGLGSVDATNLFNAWPSATPGK